MSALANAGLVAFLAVSLAVGVRLLALARRTRGVPELLIGASFVIGGVLGFVPEALATGGLLPAAIVPAVIVVSNGAIRATAILTALFTWRVFRAGDGWAALVAGVVATLLGVAYVAFPAPWMHAETSTEWWWSLATALARTFAFAWAAFESLRYWRIALRRRALGLVSAATARRFLLWGVAIGSVAAMSLVPILYRLLPAPGPDAVWTVAQSVLGLAAAVAMHRTFAPVGRAATEAVHEGAG